MIAIFIKRVLQNKPPIIYGNGMQTRDFIFIDDAIDAYDKVLTAKDNPARNGLKFGSGKEISVNKIAEVITKHEAANKDLHAIHVDPRPIEVQQAMADISKANKLLGFEPKIDFERGIALLLDWYKNYQSELWSA